MYFHVCPSSLFLFRSPFHSILAFSRSPFIIVHALSLAFSLFLAPFLTLLLSYIFFHLLIIYLSSDIRGMQRVRYEKILRVPKIVSEYLFSLSFFIVSFIFLLLLFFFFVFRRFFFPRYIYFSSLVLLVTLDKYYKNSMPTTGRGESGYGG